MCTHTVNRSICPQASLCCVATFVSGATIPLLALPLCRMQKELEKIHSLKECLNQCLQNQTCTINQCCVFTVCYNFDSLSVLTACN